VPTKNKPNELHISRIYDAPVKAVWDAWTDPAQVAQWWGPRGFTLTTHSKDLRPGGSWVYTMHGPDGVDYPNKTTYYEVEKYARLVYDHGENDEHPALFRVTVTFKEKSGKTHMEMTMALPTAEAAAETKKFIKAANGNSTWDRLAEYLEKEDTGKEKFVINRSFHAPIGLVYDMWTKPEHIANWLPPTGFAMEFIRTDMRVGGRSFYKMFNREGLTMYGSITYRDFSPTHRLVYEQDFRDESDRISRHPLLPTWPESMQTTVFLTDEGDGETRVTVEWRPAASATREEIENFVKQRTGMTAGWTGSFDKLEDYVRSKS
jgi:uncharacterized protein YndB with AHSA1/START domain